MLTPGPQRRRVAVTGMDAISCIGNTLDGIAASLRAGRSGIVVDPERVELGFRSPLCGKPQAVDPRDHLDRRARKGMGEAAAHATIAAQRAVAMAGAEDLLDSPRSGLIVGNDSSAEPVPIILETVARDKTTTTLGSNRILQAMNSTCTINMGPYFKTKGISLTVSAACSSGNHAIGLAAMLIAGGLQDLIIAGGSQETNWQGMAAFDALLTFSTRIDDPAAACRPFDRDRDGLIPSGGAAMLILEDYESAMARGAEILAEIEAYTFSSDGYHLTSGSGEGAERCIRAALADAGLAPEDIDYVNAHATGTATGDWAEAKAIHAVFGADGPPVSSTKSLTGHECWMAGAGEAVYSLLMIRDGFIAANRNYEHPDPELDPINVAAKRIDDVKLRHVLSNSFGFGGTNACVVFGRPT